MQGSGHATVANMKSSTMPCLPPKVWQFIKTSQFNLFYDIDENF